MYTTIKEMEIIVDLPKNRFISYCHNIYSLGSKKFSLDHANKDGRVYIT